MFIIPGFSSLYNSDGYKVGHNRMLATNTTRLYGTLIPRSVKHAPKGITKILSFGQQLAIAWLHHEFEENFFFSKTRSQLNFQNHLKENQKSFLKKKALRFTEDMSKYLGVEYDGKHFEELWDLGYLPIEVQALPEGIETNPNIPHMTFINTIPGYAWLTLYLETFISSLAWKAPTSATIALSYKRRCYEWVMKTDPENAWLIPWLCHDFSARGLDPYSQIASGLGHATSFLGSDTLSVIPCARFFYKEPNEECSIGSVNASEHSVTCTQLFYYEDRLRKGLENEVIKTYYSFDADSEGSIQNPDFLAIAEYMNLKDWLSRFPEGILSYVADTMNLWKVLTHIIPRLKKEILAREGKLVIRPDSGDPVDIICGHYLTNKKVRDSLVEIADNIEGLNSAPLKGVIELLWDIFGGTVNKQGYKVLDTHIGAIYGDSINLERQLSIYQKLETKKFAVTNIVLGVGSFTYQFNTRDTFGFAVKGAWFEIKEWKDDTHPTQDNSGWEIKSYNIYKDPITDDGTKKSLKGFQFVFINSNGEYESRPEVTEEEAYSDLNILHTIYKNGEFLNQTSLSEIRKSINALVEDEKF